MRGWFGESYRHYLASKLRRYAPSSYTGREFREILSTLEPSGGYKRLGSRTVRVGRLDVDKQLYEEDSDFRDLVDEKARLQEKGGPGLYDVNRDLSRYLSKRYKRGSRFLFPVVGRVKVKEEKRPKSSARSVRAKVRPARQEKDVVESREAVVAQLEALMGRLREQSEKERVRKARWYQEKKARVIKKQKPKQRVMQKKLTAFTKIRGQEWVPVSQERTFTFEEMPGMDEEVLK